MKQALNVGTCRIAEAAMWQLVERYTGRVGYQRGVKFEGLAFDPPVIDCSGWAALLLTQAMHAENEAAGRVVFESDQMRVLQTWSDRMIAEIETRTGFILKSPAITLDNLPRCATIGLKLGEPAWATNHPRPRGITHIAQVVRRPGDDAAFVSESFGGFVPPGVGLTPLAAWLVRKQPAIDACEMWVVDPFRLASTQAS
jgi:hypothetical protein